MWGVRRTARCSLFTVFFSLGPKPPEKKCPFGDFVPEGLVELANFNDSRRGEWCRDRNSARISMIPFFPGHQWSWAPLPCFGPGEFHPVNQIFTLCPLTSPSYADRVIWPWPRSQRPLRNARHDNETTFRPWRCLKARSCSIWTAWAFISFPCLRQLRSSLWQRVH